MLIAQITDMHVDPDRRLVGGRVDTVAALEAAIDHLEALELRPEVVLATGDLVQDGLVSQYRRLGEALSRLTIPAFLIPGNHDDRDGMHRVFAGRYGVSGAGGPIEPVVDLGSVRLVGIDTVIPGQTGGGLDAGRLERLDARLAAAPETPTLVFLHHPPFRTGDPTMDRVGLADPQGLAAVIGRHRQVRRIICGHVHRRIDALFAGVPATSTPSPSHQIALDLTGNGRSGYALEPRACGLHLWDGRSAFISHLSYIGGYDGPIAFGVDG